MWKHVYSIWLICTCLAGLWNCTPKPAATPSDDGPASARADEGPSPALTPAEELATFQLQPGLQIQLVASEPIVQDPVVITFDENGRLWVVEMRGFMNTIDAAGENEPIGRISVLEDTNGDGQMDKSTIYLDSLIMPRALALVPGGALVAENQALWLTQDNDGDLKADTKTLIDKSYAGSALPEHSGNGLWRGMDNWYYNAKSRLRYKLTNGEWQRDSTEFRGQWGLSHDDEGRLIYNYNWSQLHADLVPANYFSRNKNHTPTTGIDHGLTTDRRIYPIRPNPAVNRGYIPGTLDEEGKLLEFTAACSPLFYRGIALPKEYYGNVFVCEPSGNLIKRNVVKENGLLLSAFDPNPGKEFLASTDERFRPVHMATGPDGALYVADMYRGLVQHGAYITPYLKEQTLLRKLVLPVHRGRIWRIVPQGWKPTQPEKLSSLSSSALIDKLAHHDGWYRDMAQRLLIERNDLTIEKQLKDFALAGKHSLSRFHALWTLDGLHLADPDLLLSLLSDPDTLVRTTALRLLEPRAKNDQQVRAKLEEVLLKAYPQASIKQSIQMALSAPVLSEKTAHTLLAGIITQHDTSALIRDAVMSSLYNQEFTFLKQLWQMPAWQTSQPSKEIFLEMLATAIIRKRDAAELSQVLALLDKNKGAFGWKEKAIITGLSIGGSNTNMEPLQLAAAPSILKRTNHGIDSARLTTLVALFEWPGHSSVKNNLPKKNPLTADEQKLFALGRQHYLTTCAGCHGTDGAGLNRFAPPLAGSQWVTGDEKRLALIVLHGMEGPVDVNGKVYTTPDILPVMPAHTTMDDGVITAILTYIRNEWGNEAGPVSRRTVGTTRNTSQGRVIPWTAAELDKYIEENKATSGR
jgi:glucose/arabinose dehydrogenase/mono/diheme cytochrome c family protein